MRRVLVVLVVLSSREGNVANMNTQFHCLLETKRCTDKKVPRQRLAFTLKYVLPQLPPLFVHSLWGVCA